MALRPSIARPRPSISPRPTPRRTWNPFALYWRAITDDDSTWGRRLGVAVGVPFLLSAGAVLVGAAVFAGYVFTLLPETPDAYALARATKAQPTVVLDARGRALTQFEPAFREWVPLDSIPPHLVDALIATEDRKFYRHTGVDVSRTVAAIWNTATGRREGGSTITQQLARNLFPDEIGNAGTVERKTKEALAARAIERDHTKREILEAYLNTVPFLYNAHGVEMAARTYFGTHAPDLSVTEAATLVAMLKGPNQYNPVRRPEAALARRNLVLQLMEAQGHLGAAEAAEYRATPLAVDLRPQPSTYSAAPHFTAAVRRQLEAWARPLGYDIDRDGLVVHTTLDLSLQQEAQAAVTARGERLQGVANREWARGVPRRAVDAVLRRSPAFARARESGLSPEAALAEIRRDQALVDSARLASVRVEAALVAIQPETGAVRAYVGSRDFGRDEYDHAGVAHRQSGSTFKAFVFAGALQRGYAPDDELDGGAITIQMDDGALWQPSGGTSAGTLADALVYSKNAATARLTQEIGPHRVALAARTMGVTSDLDVVPSIGLGTSPVTLLEMTSAYGTIANDGLRRVPRLVTRIETASGTVLEAFGTGGRQALTQRDSRHLLDMMRQVVDRGTGRGLREMGVTGDVAGKTGTTQRYADGWFIGMRPGLVVGAWVGFNDQRVTFRSKGTGEGSKTALPVVGDFLLRVQDRLPNTSFPPAPVRYADFALNEDAELEHADDVVDRYGAEPFEWEDEGYAPEPVDLPEVERPEADRPRLRGDASEPPTPRRPSAPRPPAPAPEAAPAPTNPNNRGGMTAEEMIEEARGDG